MASSILAAPATPEHSGSMWDSVKDNSAAATMVGHPARSAGISTFFLEEDYPRSPDDFEEPSLLCSQDSVPPHGVMKYASSLPSVAHFSVHFAAQAPPQPIRNGFLPINIVALLDTCGNTHGCLNAFDAWHARHALLVPRGNNYLSNHSMASLNTCGTTHGLNVFGAWTDLPANGADPAPQHAPDAPLAAPEPLAEGVALEHCKEHALTMALDEEGCRILQRVFEEVGAADGRELADKLRGHVLALSKSMNANFVLQSMIEQLVPEAVSFIARELRGYAASVAANVCGCRVVQRLLKHRRFEGPVAQDYTDLVRNLLNECDLLVCSKFGKHVVICMLERCPPDECSEVLDVLAAGLEDFALNKHGSRVVQRAVELESEGGRVAELLLTNTNLLRALASHPYGSFVCLALLKLRSDYGVVARSMVLGDAALVEVLKGSKACKNEEGAMQLQWCLRLFAGADGHTGSGSV